MNSVMDILHAVGKGAMMDTLERYHIYKTTNLGTQINDKNTASYNILFDTTYLEDIPSLI